MCRRARRHCWSATTAGEPWASRNQGLGAEQTWYLVRTARRSVCRTPSRQCSSTLTPSRPLSRRGTSPGLARGLAHDSAASGRADARRRPGRHRARHGQERSHWKRAVQRFEGRRRGHGIEAAPALVALQRRASRPDRGRAHGSGDALGQRRHVAQTEVEALAGEGWTLRTASPAKAKRRAVRRGPSETPAARMRAGRPAPGRRADSRSAAAPRRGSRASSSFRMARPRSSLFRPGDAGAVAVERQNGERATRQEMLDGAALVRALVLTRW